MARTFLCLQAGAFRNVEARGRGDMKNSKPCVLIYNPISGHGHLDSWNVLFVGLLLEGGYRVLALTPDRRALESRLARRKLADLSLLHILDWDASSVTWRCRFDRAWTWWLNYGDIYANKRP